MNPGTHYDYIFAGSGCAALSLLMRMLQHDALRQKKILLLDVDDKNKNDRTWCFWEQEAGFFEPIVHHRWQHLYFHGPQFSKQLHIQPYAYKLIRGIDFYQHCFAKIAAHPNVHRLQARVDAVEGNGDKAWVQAGGKRYEAQYVFNSIPPKPGPLKPHEYWLLQHFKGWMVETEKDHFDPAQATLMDFRVGQEQGTTFVYVLPLSARRALVEYTLFSKEVLPQHRYDAALKDYLDRYLGLQRHRIAEEEFGVIPMTNFSFPQRQGRVLHLGTAGGNTKGSSGYTFQAIQKRSDVIVQSLLQTGHPFAVQHDAARFHFYDSVLLHILAKEKLEGAGIFVRLFKKNKATTVLRFLDNETTLAQEIKLLPTLPVLPFTRAAAEYLLLKMQHSFSFRS